MLGLYLAPDGRRPSSPSPGSRVSRSPRRAPGSSCAGRGRSPSRRSPASRSGSRSTSATRTRTCSCRSIVVVGAWRWRLGWQLLRGDERARELGPLAWPLAAVVAWTGLALLWTDDLREGAIFLAAFVLPFGLLAIGFARLPVERRPLLALYAGSVATALVYAGVGLYQWATREVFWNPKLIVDNAYAPFFRVNSVFWDPSIYGRYLVVAILATLALLLLGLRDRLLAAAIVAVAALWAGLLFSFSQSSFVALIAGTLAAATVVWRWRAAAALGLLAVVLVSVGFATPQVRHKLLRGVEGGLDAATSGRAGSSRTGSDRGRPPGRGCRHRQLQARLRRPDGLQGREPKKAASHSTPVTVAAETGCPGSCSSAGWPPRRSRAAFRARGRWDAGRLASSRGLRLARSPCTASSTTRSSRTRCRGRCSGSSPSPRPGTAARRRSA